MTPNHGYTPVDDRRREQATSGQGPAGQQSPQPNPTQQPQTQQGQPQQPQTVQGQPQQPRQQLQQGQPAQTQQATQLQGASQPTQGRQAPQGVGQAHPQGVGQPQPVQQPTRQPTQPGQQQMTSAGGPPVAGGVQQQQQYGQQSGVTQQRQPQRRATQQPILKPIRVNEIITEDVVTAEKDTPIRTVVAKMSEHDIGSVVVVEDDRPIGIITDRKVALALEEMPDIAQRTAEELLHGDVFTADPSMSIFDAVQVMSDEGIRRLPIVDDNGALRGIVTLDDALVLLGGVVSEVAETVQSQSPRL